jgi:hypothetical protein
MISYAFIFRSYFFDYKISITYAIAFLKYQVDIKGYFSNCDLVEYLFEGNLVQWREKDLFNLSNYW